MEALFSQAKAAFEISLGLTGVLSLWLGIMRIGERSGFIQPINQFLTPLFSRLMPDVPKGHPALGRYRHEHLRQYAWAGQCRHAFGH